MGLRTMPYTDGTITGAILYCSTSMRALPYMFRSEQDADDFVEIHGDVRRLTAEQREALFDEWEREQPEDEDTRHPLAVRELGDDDEHEPHPTLDENQNVIPLYHRVSDPRLIDRDKERG